MSELPPQDVVVTSYRLSAVGWVTGIIAEIYKSIYGIQKMWHYEISRFECTRERRPLPKGWSTVWDANPLLLAERGFDKVLVLVRDLMDIMSAVCWYNKHKSIAGVVRDGDFRFLSVIVKNYDKLYDTVYKHENILYVNVSDLNRNTVKGFKKICEFLEFNMDKFPVIIPTKVERDWEVYGGYNKGLSLGGLAGIKASRMGIEWNEDVGGFRLIDEREENE